MRAHLGDEWLAGLLEGEGCFTSESRGRGRRMLLIQVKMTDRDVIETVARMLGNVAVTQCRHANEHWQDTWVCKVRGKRAALIAQRLLPYMHKRRAGRIKVLLNDKELTHHA